MVHSTAAWEELLRYIGAEEFPDISWRFDPDGGLESEMSRMAERPKVRRADLLALPVGHIWVFRGNKAMLVKVELPDTTSYGPFELPEQEPLFPEAKAVDESNVSALRNEVPPEHGEAPDEPPSEQGQASEESPPEHGEAPEPQPKDDPVAEVEDLPEEAQPAKEEPAGSPEAHDSGADVEAVVDEDPDWDNIELPDGPDVDDFVDDEE